MTRGLVCCLDLSKASHHLCTVCGARRPSAVVLTLFVLYAILLGGTRILQWIYACGAAGPRRSRYRAAAASRSTIDAG